MPLSRLENFLINTDGNILYVNPSDLDATDSFDNKGNSLTRPFKTIQRALIEAARFAYQSGESNDRFDRTTILLYPGTHLVDNRPGYSVKNNSGAAQYYDVTGAVVGSPDIELANNTIFDLNNASNVLYKFNSIDGGVIVPKGTSIVGLDLRKTKVRPLYVPDPKDTTIDRSAIFRVTGGCYFWQFSLFDADRAVFLNKDFSQKANPSFSHHKLTCFEYADGINVRELTGLTDLDMYYFKLMNAYGNDTGNREIANYPGEDDFEPNSPEFKIVGDLSANDFEIGELTSNGLIASVSTNLPHGLGRDDSFRIVGVGSDTYNGSFRVSGITSERKFTYTMLSDATDDVITIGGGEKVVIEADNVTGASPYIFNISLRSTFGMCGMHADGSKATGFKSMVVAQFTGIGLQKDTDAFLIYNDVTGQYESNEDAPTTVPKPLYINQDAVYKSEYESFHVKASNDAVIQAVSVFAIGFAQHFLAVDGADQSITNSNSNFGAKSLISVGFKKQSFDRDNTGYVTHVIPPKDLQESTVNVSWRSLDPTKTISVGSTSNLYILGETDKKNPPTNITNGYRVGSRTDEKLYLTVNIDGVNTSYSAPVRMQVPSGAAEVSSKKEFTVTRTAGVSDIDTSADTLTLNANHNFLNGESVRIYSDNAVLPDPLENAGLYYVITTGLAANKIKLAKTFNNAIAGSPAVDIKNNLGGVVRVCSTVTDKIPGDLGHPIQYDDANNNWYITSSSSNEIYNSGFIGFSTTIASNNSSTFIQRIPENRDLADRIYKLRYVIPKDFANAKAPSKNFVLQETRTVGEQSSFANLTDNRNPRIIASVSISGDTTTVITEKPHGLSIGDRVRIRNVKSSGNTTAADNKGYNGHFTVTDVQETKEFKYTNSNGGTYINEIHFNRGSDPGANLDNLPVFERNEYDTTYSIQDVQVIQEYVSGDQDGIYYLTCLTSNISPTVPQFSSKKFKQDFALVYPMVDKDNTVLDPNKAVSAASNKMLGKVSVNDPTNSITKEAIVKYLEDNRVGLAITGASHSSGTVTLNSKFNHNLNSITSIGNTVAGSNYNAGVSTTLYNVALTGGTGEDATANVVVNSGAITEVTIVDGGSGYTVSDVLTIPGGDGAGRVTVSSTTANIGNVIQIVGVGVASNREDSGYNGSHIITSIPNSKSLTYALATNPGIYTSTSQPGIFYVVGKSSSVQSITGVAGTTLTGTVTVRSSTTHGFSVGNKIRIEGVTGTSASTFNNDFIVKSVISTSQFTIEANPGVTVAGSDLSSAKLLKYGIGAFGQDTSLETEKIGGSLINMPTGTFRQPLFNAQTATSGSAPGDTFNLGVLGTRGLKLGDFLQVENEIVRVKVIENNGEDFQVIRGVLGTKATEHGIGSVLTAIKVVPSEVRRFSSIRASGHTFEYVGYGPGNYSTALPQRIQRTLDPAEELLSIYLEQKGGVTFFSGMNDRGEFFTWDGRVKPQERYLGEVGSDLTATFDDIYVRNTLRVGGGPNRNLPSEFRGPVNFTNKITSTDIEDGIDAIKLQLKGNSLVNPFFQVGEDANPSLIVNQSSQNIGIKTAAPAHELDVSGTIRADIYENFKLTDLPNTPTEEVTFKRNRVLKVNEEGTGYELVDVHELDAFKLRSYGINNDPTIYDGSAESVTGTSGRLKISGISTSRFNVGEKVKVFGVTRVGVSTVLPPPTTTFVTVGASGARRYRYWTAQYHFRNGTVGPAEQASPTGGTLGVEAADFNSDNNIQLSLRRTDENHGILIYRQESASSDPADINQAKLVGILGPQELGSQTSVSYKDYAVYDQTAWSPNNAKNEYTSDQIHFPAIATTGQRRGWAIDEVVSIGSGFIGVGTDNYEYNFNSAVGFGTTSTVKVTHDNTYALSQAIADTQDSGGNYLDLPSGTYYANRVTIPSGFTLKGNGRNSILKQQFFALDSTDGHGTSLSFNGNFIGIGVTNGKDVTIADITIDGNNGNNIRFDTNDKNYLVKMPNVTSTLFKSMEIRNSPADGLQITDSRRVSIENCSFVDGSLTDRYQYQPLDAQESDVLRINDSLFEQYPGALDVSVTSVVSTGGNIIRNCGTGLRTYASGKITTTNNIILGPADEFVPSPDIYDSDFNSVNISINRTAQPVADFFSPVYQYIEKGEPKDLSSATITAGIGTIINEGQNDESLGTKFVNFDPIDAAAPFSRDQGYIQLKLNAATISATTQLSIGGTFGYNITGTEFLQTPVGFTTFVGISTGAWYKNGSPFIGAGTTMYQVTLSDPSQATGISTGDVVKLVNHSVSPSLSAQELTVQRRETVDANTIKLHLVGFTTTSLVNGGQITGSSVNGYISIRNTFTIAKGRVGVI